MVRVLVVADEEVSAARPRALRLGVDLLLSAGDLPWDYLAMLAAALQVPAAFVPGNHDPIDGEDAPAGFLPADDQVLEIAGLRIAGLGGSVRYNDGPHQYTQEQYRTRARQLAASAGGPVDILLTHAPPAGLGDESDPAHRGIEALHDLLEALVPTWHLHGHIHPYGMSKPDRQVGGTTVRNVIPWTVLEVEPRAADPAATERRRSA
ncbi:hypothetical protein BHE97_04290 [Aeromicrobium sp. PE09-221]|uniref:metallophosphoesterase family protein n=1 Tax=Aeromicrobium sp. PE09-221 TaxID=1898043 RepID=UPI000B3E6EC0|nr:metallophosphoesterase [Aeromicrobium sp. PE09-221]OUZ11727.1 hypothetical protein BHE97_04290 [Aeromicrobium sp. PE09-221]